MIDKPIKLAIKVLQAEAQRLAFDANAYDKLGATYPLALKSSKTRAACKEAINLFENMLANPAALRELEKALIEGGGNRK